MSIYLHKTANYQVELQGDLLLLKTAQGDLLRGMTVPALSAVSKFKEMISRVNAYEAQKA